MAEPSRSEPQPAEAGLEGEGRLILVDQHVGSRLRFRRVQLGLSQEQLATAVGISFQQIQKYERGMNRIGASRLFELTRVLQVPVSFFFDGAPDGANPDEAAPPDSPASVPAELMNAPETLALIRAFHGIMVPEIRRRVLGLVRSLAPQG
ncbi:helix-turn-helix transcriptional regulator [Roseomonas sp. SSH11]|uniref:Helix-turn-helix transcriptional regulator n=1 Tax=Pararoseomonas baculiformis TaxID=2820812 RepID=A0ABS4AE48_9PROT|nr:helix-turn-helix transcriptional regulator [Pararoseomonas baculiformis]MBP0445263.1 helix-turn-helix transcriptional regulator [Pararoseomonas baculiformis]